MHRRLFLATAAVALAAPAALAQDAKKLAVWTEPNEKAYSLVIPEGWTVRGGLSRPNPLAFVTPTEITSPDKRIIVRITDDYPVYVEQNETHIFMGLRNGHREKDQFGVLWEIQPYAPGAEFLKKHALRGVKLGEARKVSALSSDAGFGIQQRTDCGEIEYRYTIPGERTEWRGAALAITEFVGGGLTRIWTARMIQYEAPADRIEEAKATALRALVTMQFRAGWVAAQEAGQRDRIRIAKKSIEDTNRVFWETYNSVQESRCRIFQRGSDVRRDVVTVYNPHTGTIHYNVPGHSSYYWLAPNGQIIGTNTGTPPGGASPLTVLP